MNIICKLLGHKWSVTSFRQYVKIKGKMVDCWVLERHCDRCNTDERMNIEILKNPTKTVQRFD